MIKQTKEQKKVDYFYETKKGHKIVARGFYKYGELKYPVVIFYREKTQDYNIALNYSWDEGTWGQGIYDFVEYEEAEKWLRKNKTIIILEKAVI